MTNEQVQALANEYAYKAMPAQASETELRRAMRTTLDRAFVHGFAACEQAALERLEAMS